MRRANTLKSAACAVCIMPFKDNSSACSEIILRALFNSVYRLFKAHCYHAVSSSFRCYLADTSEFILENCGSPFEFRGFFREAERRSPALYPVEMEAPPPPVWRSSRSPRRWLQRREAWRSCAPAECRPVGVRPRRGELSPTGSYYSRYRRHCKRRRIPFNCVKGIRSEKASKSLYLQGFSRRL